MPLGQERYVHKKGNQKGGGREEERNKMFSRGTSGHHKKDKKPQRAQTFCYLCCDWTTGLSKGSLRGSVAGKSGALFARPPPLPAALWLCLHKHRQHRPLLHQSVCLCNTACRHVGQVLITQDTSNRFPPIQNTNDMSKEARAAPAVTTVLGARWIWRIFARGHGQTRSLTTAERSQQGKSTMQRMKNAAPHHLTSMPGICTSTATSPTSSACWESRQLQRIPGNSEVWLQPRHAGNPHHYDGYRQCTPAIHNISLLTAHARKIHKFTTYAANGACNRGNYCTTKQHIQKIVKFTHNQWHARNPQPQQSWLTEHAGKSQQGNPAACTSLTMDWTESQANSAEGSSVRRKGGAHGRITHNNTFPARTIATYVHVTKEHSKTACLLQPRGTPTERMSLFSFTPPWKPRATPLCTPLLLYFYNGLSFSFSHSLSFFFFFFYYFIVPLGFLPQQIRITFPGGRQLAKELC